MNKYLIGAIIALILLALLPIKSETFTLTNSDPATNTITEDADKVTPLVIRLNESNQENNTVLTQAENLASDYEIVEIEQLQEQEILINDRNIFISIGSILLFSILLLLPLHHQKF